MILAVLPPIIFLLLSRRVKYVCAGIHAQSGSWREHHWNISGKERWPV